MDIRRFLGGKTAKSGLSTRVPGASGSDDVDKNVTPSLKAPKVKKPSKATNENKLDGIDLLNSSGDSDSVIPKRVKEHMREKMAHKKQAKPKEIEVAEIVEAPSTSGTKRRVCISSDEDEEFQRKKKPEPKRRKQRSPSPAPVEPMDLSDVEEDEEIQEVPAKRGKRNRTPPGQMKLNFAAMGAKQGGRVSAHVTAKKPSAVPETNLSRVNVDDYFSTFGGAKPTKKDKRRSDPELETKETKQFEVVDLDSPAPSPKKAKKSKEEPPKKAKPASPKKAAMEPVKPKARDERKPSSFENSKDVELPRRVESAPIDRNSLMWVDKYKPLSLKQLVGQSGEKSPMNKLLGWLRDWPKFHMGEAAHQKKAKPAPWMAQSDGSAFKAALLSGPPGIGKTTCAAMACKELGIELLETNASDARSKKCLEAVLGDLTGSHQINRMFGEQKKPVEKDALTHVLIMDEVDGMSGNEDRAGIAELIQLIKTSKVPIICICNDRQSPKMRSLVNHCFDLRFQRPRVEAIRARIMTIVHQEGIKGISKEQIDEIIEASNHDVRQTIYNLQMFKCGNGAEQVSKKDVNMNTFEAARRIMSGETNLKEKQELFFTDYSILPLFVYENYLNIGSSTVKLSRKQELLKMKAAMVAIALGDVAEKTIRSTGAWSLLPTQAMLSCAIPSHHMNGHLRSMINFPAWLGKNSNFNKRKRLLQQLGSHSYLNLASDVTTMACDYVEPLQKAITVPLVQKEGEGVREVIDFYNHYALTKEDAESINELATWPDQKAAKIETKVKSALTRALNKEHRLLPYAQEEVAKGRRGKAAAGAAATLAIDEEGNEIELGDEDADESDDEAEEDAKAKPAKAAPKRGGGAARGRGRGRGKGAK